MLARLPGRRANPWRRRDVVRERQRRRQRAEVVPRVHLAEAEAHTIDGEEDAAISYRDGAPHQIQRRIAVLQQIALVPAMRGRRRGRDVLDADRRMLTQSKERAGAAAGARGGALALAVDERMDARGRGEDGQRELVAEELAGRRERIDRPQRARPQRVAAEGRAVLPQRDLVAGADARYS